MRTVTPVRFTEAPKLHTRRIQSSFSEILEETARKANFRSGYGSSVPVTAL